MQKSIWVYLVLVLYAVGLTSCDNELNVAAEWEETAVIYGLLNPTDENQYIRIQRTYLDEKRGAMMFSSIPDSLYFDTLSVTIDEYDNGSYVQTFTLKRVDGNLIGLPKDSGTFTNDVNYLYEMSDPVRASNFFHDYSYVIKVFHPGSGYLATANAVSMGQAEMSSPVSEFVSEIFLSSNEKHSVLVKYQEGKHVMAYDMVMKVYIEEIDKADTTQRITKVIDWRMLTENLTTSLSGYNQERKIIYSQGFFNTLGAQLEVDPTIYRRLLSFDLLLYGYAEDVHTYINVNKPSIGIVQKKPEFTNINNGIGLFSSRHINKFIDGSFHPDTYVHLQLSDETNDLGFVNY